MIFGRREAAASVLLAALALSAPAFGCDLATATTTRWSLSAEQGVAWLVTPCGDRFYSIGVNVLDAGIPDAKLDRPHYDWQRFDPSLDAWIEQTRQHLDDWGFNSAGGWSLPPQQLKLPSIINLELGRIARFHWFDPFDPATAARVNAEALRLTAPYRDSPYRIGYFSDNEIGWWGGALFVFYAQKPASNFTKQRWVKLLRELYHDDWRRFAQDFVPPAGVMSWRGLLAAEAPTRLRPGGSGIRAVRRWTELVAAHYYAVTAAALKAADPEALFFGDRLPIYYDPGAVRAEARYTDALAVNYNVDSPEGWIAPYFFDGLRTLTGGKPALISEWFFAATENRTGNRNNGHLMTVATQAERAAGAAAAARNFAARPEILGLHWFQYYDYPLGGRADHEDYDFGLVDIANQPYEQLVSALGAANRELPDIHAEAHLPVRQERANFLVPYAVIDPAHRSLVDWPKPQALLPPLRSSAGDVAFGEAYLSWSQQGLALATIGQDYYDLDLLDYHGEYPLAEAYRVELDVDAGAGAKRFTFYFIPPRGKTKDYPPMEPKLCLGAPTEHQGDECPPVPGAQALYFGADQPRITAEALIPWVDLGLDGPPQDGRLKIEVSAVAWMRARWISLSGLTPEKSSADPASWTEVQLGAAQ